MQILQGHYRNRISNCQCVQEVGVAVAKREAGSGGCALADGEMRLLGRL